MDKLDKAIELLLLRHDSLIHTVKYHAERGDYERAAMTQAKASEVFNLLVELTKLKEEP